MNKKTIYVLGTVIGIAVLAFAYYAVSPLFINVKLDEAMPEAPQIDTTIPVVSAEVVGTLAHPASGTARIVAVEGKNYVRYENFKTINGPDIYVYLAKDLDAKEFVSLGRVKATEGNINYEIPPGVNVSDYRYVMVWCKAFGVLFNYADLKPVG